MLKNLYLWNRKKIYSFCRLFYVLLWRYLRSCKHHIKFFCPLKEETKERSEIKIFDRNLWKTIDSSWLDKTDTDPQLGSKNFHILYGFEKNNQILCLWNLHNFFGFYQLMIDLKKTLFVKEQFLMEIKLRLQNSF